MKITYYANNDTMGDTAPEDCDRFRAWAEDELRTEYPNDEIIVTSEQHMGAVEINPTDEAEAEADDYFDRERGIEDFCSRLWDRMEW